MSTCSDHDVLQEHAVVDQRASSHDLVHGEHQPHGRIEEAVVALVLGVHLVLVALGDAEQAIQAPAVFAPAVYVGRYPFLGVVVVFLPVLRGQRRIGAQGVVGADDLVHQGVTAGALQHIGFPGLGVGARRCAAGHVKNVRNGFLCHRFWQKFAHRLAALYGLINRVGTRYRKGCIHLRVSSTESNSDGRGTGRLVCLST